MPNSHVNESDAQFPLHALKLKLHLFSHLEVQCAQRLVEEQDPGAVDDRSRNGDSLHLAARQLVNVPLAVIRKTDGLKRLLYALIDLRLSDLLYLEAECNVVEDVEVREKRISLENGVDVSLVRRSLEEILALEINDAGISSLKACDDAERCRLSAARRTEERDELIVPDIERDILEDLRPVKALVQVLDLNDVLRTGIVFKYLIVSHLFPLQLSKTRR